MEEGECSVIVGEDGGKSGERGWRRFVSKRGMGGKVVA